MYPSDARHFLFLKIIRSILPFKGFIMAMKRALESLDGSIVWFRSDLRVHDNPALSEAAHFASKRGASLTAVYCFNIEEMKEMNLGPVRVDFILRTLKELQESLLQLGIPLHVLVMEKTRSEEYGHRLVEFAHQLGAGSIFFNKEADPVGIRRDEKVKSAFGKLEVTFQEFSDQCIVKEGFVLTKQAKPYAMFTPFKNCWLQHIKDNPIKLVSAPEARKIALDSPKIPSSIPGFELGSQSGLDGGEFYKLFPAGEAEAIRRLTEFLEQVGKNYKDTRNFPSINGTSRLSPYLAVGAISPKMAFEMTRKANHGHLTSGSEGLQTFMSELCWRDFYRHILHHFPHISSGAPFKPEAANIEWREDEEAMADFKRWCKGETGIPIVDAAMRQLSTTGWMHNRLRMIVSMFLTKDLLISWKLGESWFAKHLVDYDFPSNNGGWQWSSSTGTDAQPYFRIFNPFTQSENFDKDGIFIKRFVPELASVPASAIHNPAASLSKSERTKLCPNYPEPMVDHAWARNRALEVFKKAFKKL